MKYKARKIGIIDAEEVYQVAAPLNKQIEAFKAKGINYPFVAYPYEVAKIRLNSISNDYSRTNQPKEHLLFFFYIV